MEFIPGVKGRLSTHKSINVMHHINRMKDGNHILVSINAEKALDKIQHFSMIKKKKTPNKVGIEGTHLNIVKSAYDNPMANIILSDEKMKAFPRTSGLEGAHCHSPVQRSTESPSQSSQAGKKSRHPIMKEVKLLLFENDLNL